MSGSALADDRLDQITAAEGILWCARDTEACLALAGYAVDCYAAEMSPDNPQRLPFCLREGDDPAKTFAAVFVWFYGQYREQYDVPFVEPTSTSYLGYQVTWDDLLAAPAKLAAILLVPLYPCEGVAYDERISAMIRWDGYENEGGAR